MQITNARTVIYIIVQYIFFQIWHAKFIMTYLNITRNVLPTLKYPSSNLYAIVRFTKLGTRLLGDRWLKSCTQKRA